MAKIAHIFERYKPVGSRCSANFKQEKCKERKRLDIHTVKGLLSSQSSQILGSTGNWDPGHVKASMMSPSITKAQVRSLTTGKSETPIGAQELQWLPSCRQCGNLSQDDVRPWSGVWMKGSHHKSPVFLDLRENNLCGILCSGTVLFPVLGKYPWHFSSETRASSSVALQTLLAISTRTEVFGQRA